MVLDKVEAKIELVAGCDAVRRDTADLRMPAAPVVVEEDEIFPTAPAQGVNRKVGSTDGVGVKRLEVGAGRVVAAPLQDEAPEQDSGVDGDGYFWLNFFVLGNGSSRSVVTLSRGVFYGSGATCSYKSFLPFVFEDWIIATGSAFVMDLVVSVNLRAGL